MAKRRTPATDPALKSALHALIASGRLSEDELGPLIAAVNSLTVDAYKTGVKNGYLKILVDQRNGDIDIPFSDPKTINEAIRKAQEHQLSPSLEFIPRGRK